MIKQNNGLCFKRARPFDFPGFNPLQKYLAVGCLCFSLSLHASFIESTIGAAVVDDATATYYNPAALTRLKNTQIIALGSIGRSQSQFSGQSIQLATGFIQSGSTTTQLNYFLPSFYLGMPVTDKIRVGAAVIANDFNNDIEGHSILRYAQSNNKIQDVDFVPAIGFKFNDSISFGAGLNRSRAHFLLQPVFGFPTLNIPDSQSYNESWGSAWGGDLGLFLKPGAATVLGFNYRSAIRYELRGKSIFKGHPVVVSDTYRFNYWTPARSVVSASHALTPAFGVIGTVQYIQWDIFKEVTIHQIAVPMTILPMAKVHYHFHNTWLATLGANYRISSKWVIRAAGSYIQAPSHGAFQIDNGDSITVGASMGYNLFKNIILDCSYAHAFIKDQAIHARTAQNVITGMNQSAVNAVAIKLIVNIPDILKN